MGLRQARFRTEKIGSPCAGLEAYRVSFESQFFPDPFAQCMTRKAHGRIVVLDPGSIEMRIYPFYELIHRSWRPGTPNFVRALEVINLGTTVKDFITNIGGCELGGIRGCRSEQVRAEIRRCVFACNTLQTGFVRGNGFIIAPPNPGCKGRPKLICKPPEAPGMYDPEYIALGPRKKDKFGPGFDGQYDTFVLAPTPRLERLRVNSRTDVKLRRIKLGFASPAIVRKGKLCANEIPFHDNPKDKSDPKTGRGTIGNEVNWSPSTTGASYTAFGCAGEKIVVASMVQSDRGDNCGILAAEMALLLLRKEFGVQDAVIGGGSADTQQYLKGDAPDEFLEAPARPKKESEHAGVEVSGARGLGAIFAVLEKR